MTPQADSVLALFRGTGALLQGHFKLTSGLHSAQYLDGAHVDYVETVMGAGFKVDNPNAVSSCGCGSSFRPAGAEPAATGGGCGCG